MNDDSFIFMTVKEMNLTDSDKHIQTFSQSKADFIDSFNELSIKLNYFFRFKLYPRKHDIRRIWTPLGAREQASNWKHS